MAFKKGNRLASGGAREGAGRPTDEFRSICAQALNDVKGIDLVKAIIAGVKFEGPWGLSAARPETRFEAVKWLAERAHGKAAQPLEHTGKDGEALTVRLVRYE